MKRFPMCSVVAAALSILSVPGRAHADPIVLTVGVVAQSSGSDLPGFTVSGSGSSFTGVLGISGVICCSFAPGDVVKVSWFFPITRFGFPPSTQIVEGTVFRNTALSGQMTFTAAPFVAPPVAPASREFSFHTSFTMTGEITGFQGSFRDEFQVFSVPVAGTGTATVSGRVEDNGSLFLGTFLGFHFQDPAPTPEPAPLVLLGTALVGGLGVAARRRRSTASAPSRT